MLIAPGGSKGCGTGEACVGFGKTGYGVYSRTGLAPTVEAYVAAKLVLADARTIEPISVSRVTERQALAGLEWKDEFAVYSPEQKDQVRVAIEQLLRRHLASGFDFLGLKPAQ